MDLGKTIRIYIISCAERRRTFDLFSGNEEPVQDGGNKRACRDSVPAHFVDDLEGLARTSARIRIRKRSGAYQKQVVSRQNDPEMEAISIYHPSGQA